MESFDFRGLQIRFVREGKGEPVVLLHNGGTSHAIWRDVVPQLADSHEVFALDLLGFGASDKPGTGYTIDTYIAMLGEFIDAYGLAPVALVGNCMGSAISLGFAMQRKDDVRALVLVNPLTEATFDAGWLGTTLRLQKSAPKITGPLFQQLGRLRLPSWMASSTLAFQLGKKGRSQKVQSTEELCACASSEGQLRSLLGVLEDLTSYAAFDIFEPSEGFPPITTIWGLENRVLSPEAGRRLNARLLPVSEHWLEGCGHLPMLEDPSRVASIVERALADSARTRALG